MTQKYEGMAVGGPKAGQWLTGTCQKCSVEVVATMYPRDPRHIEDTVRQNDFATYFWVERYRIGMWVMEGLSIEDAWRELLTHYRPAAFKDGAAVADDTEETVDLPENPAFEQWCYSSLDERFKLNGKPLPVVAVVLYRVCKNDPKAFAEACRALQLAFEAGASAARKNDD